MNFNVFMFSFAVTRLREHWDETSQCVLQRKSQLTSMLGDSQRYILMVEKKI